MALPSATSAALNQALNQIMATSSDIKVNGANAVSTLAAGSVDTNYVFMLLDRLRQTIVTLNQVKGVAGLNAYATAQLPGYAGAMVADINATIAACQACIDWVVGIFPKDASVPPWLLAESLNADGSRTPRLFTPAQTAGLRTALTSLIATIG
jgi:hypothetical protein